jgi:hypothetical protein
MDLRRLKEHVYCMEIKPALADKKQKVSEIEHNTTILRNYTAESMKISDEDLATLEIYLDGEFYQSLYESMDSVRKGRLHTFEEVFGAQ